MTGRERIQADEEKLFGGFDQVPPREKRTCLKSLQLLSLRLVCGVASLHPHLQSRHSISWWRRRPLIFTAPQEKGFVGALAGTVLVGAIYLSLSGGSISGGINPYGVTR